MTSQIVFLGFVLMCLCAGFVTLFLRAFYQKSYINALIFKGISSLCFVAFGAINCLTNELSPTTILIFVGLCFGIIGDEIIALCYVMPEHDTPAFICGGSCFIMGHIVYVLALLLLGKMNWIMLVVCFALGASLSMLYEKRKKFLSNDMKRPLAMYLGIVIFMMSAAAGLLFKSATLGAGLFTLGGILFTVSDNILFAYKIGEKPDFKQNIVLHIAYYLAQFAIAWSISLL